MATAIGRRGPDDRRSSVLATSEIGRIRGETSLPAHRAGGRIPVGGAGLRSRLATITAVTTAVAALAFLIPLGWELRADHRDGVMSAAQRRSAMIAGSIAAAADRKGLAAAVAAAGGQTVVHPPGDGRGRRGAAGEGGSRAARGGGPGGGARLPGAPSARWVSPTVSYGWSR